MGIYIYICVCVCVCVRVCMIACASDHVVSGKKDGQCANERKV